MQRSCINLCGGDAMARKIFSTTIDEDILQEFKVACTIKRRNMNEVLEEFMRDYAEKVQAKK
jgi:hypothetical protein